jgi:DNA modification methylase
MNQANFLHLDLIKIGERTRELDPTHRDELVKQIRGRGHLLQAICLLDDNSLLAGLHRLEALRVLHAEAFPVYHGDELIPYNCAPFVRFSELSAQDMLELELAENLFRKDLTWQQKNDALARLHRMEEHPDGTPATYAETASKLAGATGRHPTRVAQSISRAVILSDAAKDNPALLECRSEAEAFSRLKSDITRISSNLLSGSFTDTTSLHTLLEGDLRDLLPELDEGSLDLILGDPPYGIGADTWSSKFIDAPHRYKDDWKYAAEIYAAVCTYGFRAAKPLSNMFLFCAPEKWHLVRDIAEAAGWTTWGRPVIWHKSNEGIRPWSERGYAYCYEAILFATKGRKGTIRTGPDVIADIYKVRDREHGAAKPVPLYRYLIESTCLPGSHVLDPCAGSGTIFEAATLSNMIATGIEDDDNYIGMCQKRMQITPDAASLTELELF